MFSVVISEKGGEERREVFHGAEVSVGRVRGNDLVLAKGNVSKRHARLTQKDGRFVVVDHNSTNGTYVNRQRIVQATIVREGDRIYVGDFVLRIEGAVDSQPGESDSRLPSEGTTGNVDGWEEPSEQELKYPAVPPAPRLPAMDPRGPMMAAPDSAGAKASRAPRTEAGARRADLGATESIRRLVERVADKVERRILDRDIPDSVARRIEAALVDELGRQRVDPGLSAELPEEKLLAMARAELIGLGPLEALLKNSKALQLTVNGTLSASLLVDGEQNENLVPFSCAESLDRVLARLSRMSEVSHDGRETFLSGRLDKDVVWKAVRKRAAPDGIVIAMRRQTASDCSLENLVRDGTISRAMATFFGHCVAARVNLMIVGSRAASVNRVISALASEITERPLLVLEQHHRLVSGLKTAIRLDSSTACLDPVRLVDFAETLPQASPVVENLVGPCLPAVLDIVGRGLEGLIAGVQAGGVESGLNRLASSLSLQCAGVTAGAARLSISSCLEVCVDVCSPADGRDRVRRVVEVTSGADGQCSYEDIFTFSVERTAAGGAVEGAFHAMGVEPKLVEQLRARGISVDDTLFHRPPSSA